MNFISFVLVENDVGGDHILRVVTHGFEQMRLTIETESGFEDIVMNKKQVNELISRLQEAVTE